MRLSCMNILVCILTLVIVEGRYIGDSGDVQNMFTNTGPVSNNANKISTRAVSMAVRGVNALKKLLTGSKTLNVRSKTYRRYEKTGDFETAMKEFYAVKPSNVRERKNNFTVQFQAGRVITGNVGNRRLVLKSHGVDGRPSIEVIETKFEPGPYIDQIVYRNQ